MEVVLTKSKKPDKKSTMPGLALKLLVLVRRVLQTSPNIKIHIEKKNT